MINKTVQKNDCTVLFPFKKKTLTKKNKIYVLFS